MTATRGLMVGRIFDSLRVRNFRLYFVAQSISLSGTWAQRIAQAWLVLDMTNSGTSVGLLAAVHFLPIMMLAPLGGLIADRMDKRRLLYATQVLASVAALALGILVLFDLARVWMVFGFAFILGVSTSIDAPTRQTLVLEMVGHERLTNAVSLNSSLVNAARVIGPSIAGWLIISVGIAWCFLINAFSYMALILALLLMKDDELQPGPKAARGPAQLREGLRYARATPSVLLPIVLMAVVGVFAWEYEVVLPLLARFTFGGSASTFALMTASMGVGAVIGALITATRPSPSYTALGRSTVLLGLTQVGVSFAPTLPLGLVGLGILGGMTVSFAAKCNATLQLASSPHMRGRVIGLFILAFAGSTPIGAPLMGWVGETLGPRWALGLGGAAVLLLSAFTGNHLKRVDSVRQALARGEAPGQ